MDKLIAKIQASRNVADPVLYLGALQGNNDQYFSANNLYSQSSVPPPPPQIFRENGATVEIDNRPFMTPSLQVPRNPEQEALNQYFNQQRINDYARGQKKLVFEETLSKQAELVANAVVRDEMDRRAGIRRTVLEATGLTPAQIQQQMVSESLAGINMRVIDVRDRQIQDAINTYYNINNIPIPITQPADTIDSIAPTVHTEAGNQLPMSDVESANAADVEAVQAQPAEAEPEGAVSSSTAEMQSSEMYPNDGLYGPANAAAGSPPEFARGNVVAGRAARDAAVDSAINSMSKRQLAEYIVQNNIQTSITTLPQGGMRSVNTLVSGKVEGMTIGIDTLRDIVRDHMNSALNLNLAGTSGIGEGK